MEAPRTAAPVNGVSVDEEEGVLYPVAPATPGTLPLVVRVVAAGLGFAGADVTATRPTEVVVAETSVDVAVVNITCGTTYVLEEYVIVVQGREVAVPLPTTVATAETPDEAEGAGVGARVIVVGTAVTIPGLVPMYPLQIPVKYDKAVDSSEESLLQA
jgi:hypothetical protein